MADEKWLIDANATIAQAEKIRDLHPKGSRARDSYNSIIGFIKYNSSTVDAAEVVHGRWIYKWDAERDPKKLFVRVVCSACNLHTGQKSNYCPNCGAKMDGGNEDG